MITEPQKDKLRAYLQTFLQSENVYNVGSSESYKAFWEKRNAATVILNETLNKYLQNEISLREFKETNEKLCREFPFWGFKNFSGQMQLNQYVNNIDDSAKEDILKRSLQVPSDLSAAKDIINEMSEYLSTIKQSSENPKAIPRVNQSFLLSYFWEIQEIGKFPVYFGSSKKILVDLGLMNDSYESHGEEYETFVAIINEIAEFLKADNVDLGERPYWFVEHILWNSYMDNKPAEPEKIDTIEPDAPKAASSERGAVITGSSNWVPPIIADLEDLAFNQETEWTKTRNIKPEKAFETKLRYAFTIMGFDTEELGQGKGRQPDGVAISRDVDDGQYAIVYDAKARENYYSVGTGDREMSEYIRNKKTELRRRNITRIYFVIVSSEFGNNPNDVSLIREVYRKTQVPVTLLKASDLLFIIENKLKNSDLNHTYLEDLFLDTGVKTRSQVVDLLSNKIEL